jgi:glycosyltransferase involved in cell wall biosynthesis
VKSCVAVIPARRAEATLTATLECLRLGNDDFVERVLVVTSADDPTADVVRAWNRRDPRVELVALAKPSSAGFARNAGRAASGQPGLLLFVDADCRLQAGGAARLAAELDGRGAAAISARVACEGGAVARVRHLLEFKEASSLREPPAGWLPPSTTMMCRSDAFDRAGGFPDLWPGEDLVFSQRLRDLGVPVLRSREVVTVHTHPRGVCLMLAHQLRLGRTAARARRIVRMKGSSFTRSSWLAAGLFPARALRIAAWQVREGRAAVLATIAVAPLVLAGLAFWTAGFMLASGGKRRTQVASRQALPTRTASRNMDPSLFPVEHTS